MRYYEKFRGWYSHCWSRYGLKTLKPLFRGYKNQIQWRVRCFIVSFLDVSSLLFFRIVPVFNDKNNNSNLLFIGSLYNYALMTEIETKQRWEILLNSFITSLILALLIVGEIVFHHVLQKGQVKVPFKDLRVLIKHTHRWSILSDWAWQELALCDRSSEFDGFLNSSIGLEYIQRPKIASLSSTVTLK